MCGSDRGAASSVGLLEALERLRETPAACYSDAQWDVLRALLRTLKLAVAQLRMVFREERVIDFMELGIAAREALGRSTTPPKSPTAWIRASSICWSTNSRTRRARSSNCSSN